MAGLGARLFPAFSKLTAAQVNGYLMDQTIMRFADAAARDAAFGGAGEPTLAEGMTCYLDDTNVLQSYTGSTWVTLTSNTYPPALELITTCTVTSVGGTSATASGGVVTIGTSNTSVTVSNAFSANHDNYIIMISGGVASTDLNLRLTLGSTATGYYYGGMFAKYDGTNSSFAAVANNTFFDVGYASTNALSGKAEIDSPFLAKRTIARTISTGSSTTYYMNNYAGFLDNATSYTAFTITPSTGTITGGTIRVYGYRNQL